MDRRTAGFFGVALIALAAVGIGAAIVGSRDKAMTRPDGAPTVDGIVVAVDSAGLGDVRSFTLRSSDGRTLTFGLANLRNGATFPPGHLAEHVATSAPVRVWYEESGDQLQALWLEDLPAT